MTKPDKMHCVLLQCISLLVITLLSPWHIWTSLVWTNVSVVLSLVGMVQTTIFFFKLHMWIVDDERRNPIDFGSRGQKSRLTLAISMGMPGFVLPFFLIETTQSYQKSTCIDCCWSEDGILSQHIHLLCSKSKSRDRTAFFALFSKMPHYKQQIC